MNLSAFAETVQTSWSLVPFPVLLFYIAVLCFAWLFVEYQITCVTRRTPGWRSAPPVLPTISIGTLWLLKISRVLFWLWLIFFLALLLALLSDQYLFGYSTDLGRTMLTAGRMWRDFYIDGMQQVRQLFIALVPLF
jgi:hypothetical protein